MGTQSPFCSKLCTKALIIALAIVVCRVDQTSGQETSDGISPFFSTYCLKCHGPQKPKGEFSLVKVGADPNVAANIASWQKILDKVEALEMPPEDSKQPDAQLRTQIVAWIKQELRATGAKVDDGKMAQSFKGQLGRSRLSFFEQDNNQACNASSTVATDGPGLRRVHPRFERQIPIGVSHVRPPPDSFSVGAFAERRVSRLCVAAPNRRTGNRASLAQRNSCGASSGWAASQD